MTVKRLLESLLFDLPREEPLLHERERIPATVDEDTRPPRLRSVPREQKDGGHG